MNAIMTRLRGRYPAKLPMNQAEMDELFAKLVFAYGIPNDDGAKMCVSQAMMKLIQEGKRMRPTLSLLEIVNEFRGAEAYGAAYGNAFDISAKKKAEKLAQATETPNGEGATVTSLHPEESNSTA